MKFALNTLTRFAFLLLLPFGLCGNPPNVLLICVDDLRAELGCYGSPLVQSPFIDSLAADGLKFNRAYIQQAVCLPSRTSMLTGLRPETTGVSRFEKDNLKIQQMIAATLTLPQYLKQNGFETLTVGKVFHHFSRDRFDEYSLDDTNAWSDQRFAGANMFMNPATREEIRQRTRDAEARGLTNRALTRESTGPAIDVYGNADADGLYLEDANIIDTSPNSNGFNPANDWALSSGASTSIALLDGLSLTGVESAGGSVIFTQTGGSGTGSSSTSRGLETGLFGGDTLHAAFLIERSDVGNSGRTEINFTRGGSDGDNGPLSLGMTGDEMHLLYRDNNGGNRALTTSVNLSANTTYLLTLEIDVDGGTGGADRLVARLFAEGDMISVGHETAALTALDADVFHASDGIFSAIQPRTADGYTTGGSWTYDELRIGTDFASVVGSSGGGQVLYDAFATSSVGGDVHPNDFTDGKIASEAIALLEQYKDDQFFLAVGFQKPHLPWAVPEEHWDRYDDSVIPLPDRSEPTNHSGLGFISGWNDFRNYWDVPSSGDVSDPPADQSLDPDDNRVPRNSSPADTDTRDFIRAYYACVSHIDDQIGRVLAKVDELGLRDDTIIILWSDHGWMLGEHGDWNKHTATEYDLQIPFIVSGPGVVVNQSTEAIVEAIDLFPTIAELVGLPIPDHIEGSSFANVLVDPTAGDKLAAFSWAAYPDRVYGHTMRTEDYSYTKYFDRDTDAYLGEDLYDLSGGRFATENLAVESDYADVVREHITRVNANWPVAMPSTDPRAPAKLSAVQSADPDGIERTEGFEDYATGALSAQTGWFQGGAAAVVTPGSGSAQALESPATADRPEEALSRYFEVSDASQIWVTFDAKLPAAPLPAVMPDNAGIAFTVNEDGLLTAFDGAAESWLVSASSVSATTWKAFEVYVDFARQRWNLKMDGNLIFSDLPTRTTRAEFLTRFSLLSERYALPGDAIRIDELRVFARPGMDVPIAYDEFAATQIGTAAIRTGSPRFDAEGDGLLNVFEYATLSDPMSSDAGDPPVTFAAGEDSTTPFSMTFDLREDGTTFEIVPEISQNLVNWHRGSGHIHLVDLGSNGDGTKSYRAESLSDFSLTDKEFLRLLIEWD